MKSSFAILCFGLCLYFAPFCSIEGCSTFYIEKKEEALCSRYVAKSYDWIAEDGLVVVNKRQIAKRAMSLNPFKAKPLEWVSKYGSVVFVQAGRELPIGGMNEKGLIVELMWLEDTVYPSPDNRSTVNQLQWIQYQLDTASTVEEVVESDIFLRIDPASKALLHYMVIDSTGNVAVIEFLNGKMVVHTGKELIVPVLTNHTYEKSLAYLAQHQGFGGDLIPNEGFYSLDRFVSIVSNLESFSASEQVIDTASVFQILSKVANFEDCGCNPILPEDTNASFPAKWNIVYDLLKNEIHFFTKGHREVRIVSLNNLDFNGNTQVKVLNIQAVLSGNVNADFVPYTYELNRDLIDRYCSQIPFLKDLPEEFKEGTARYPESTFYVGDQ